MQAFRYSGMKLFLMRVSIVINISISLNVYSNKPLSCFKKRVSDKLNMDIVTIFPD